jgi:TRAP-type C4-dicarboxylate transport system permease small subunit
MTKFKKFWKKLLLMVVCIYCLIYLSLDSQRALRNQYLNQTLQVKDLPKFTVRLVFFCSGGGWVMLVYLNAVFCLYVYIFQSTTQLAQKKYSIRCVFGVTVGLL